MTKTNKNEDDMLIVLGARVHNLKNIDISIPRDKFVVITGLSGSGKSSLAFDTIYAEGQRRYMETFSAYARQFVGNMERPDVDKISGLSPVIAIEQKSVNKNPRSTVGTITEVYDYLRLLYARAAIAHSYSTGEEMVKYSEDQISKLILNEFNNKNISVLAPVVKRRKGHYRELFEQIRQQGYLKVRIDTKIQEISFGLQLDRYKVHDIEVVIDRIAVDTENPDRLKRTIKSAIKLGKGSLMVIEKDSEKVRHFSSNLMCPTTGLAYDDPEPNTFSFNSPYGACEHCNGLGYVKEIDLAKIMPNPKLNIKRGGIAPLGEYKNNWVFNQITAIGIKHGFDLNTPISKIPKEAIDTILYGSNETFDIKKDYLGITSTYTISFDGIIKYVENYSTEKSSQTSKRWAESFMNTNTCTSCNGARLKKESLNFLINKLNISDLSQMDINKLRLWMDTAENSMDKNQKKIAHEIIIEIKKRLDFLLDVGLGYLNLFRTARSLSGGESQRIRLATQIGSQLTGVMYILDEPSIGLHQRDNLKLIKALKNLRNIGNSVIVVEHDKDTILAADHIIDIGPGAGKHGGEIVAQGTPKTIINNGTITAEYLNGTRKIEIPQTRRTGNSKNLILKGASGNNLKNVTFKLPLGKLICVTGVSGSGKSSLINGTLYPILSNHFYHSLKDILPYKTILGIDNIDKVIAIDQTPIGRTPRSNPATYTKVFDEIRKLYGSLPESKIRGYKPGRFSFNVVGGRCETCKGAGVKTIEMNFLPDVYVACDSCMGKRYNRETIEVRYKGKSINDVLNLTINQAVVFFKNIHFITNKLTALQDVGLGYLTLGQASTTISGGEAQRVKLAAELSKKDTGNTLYILDEPTTGLHFEDVKVLLGVLNRLVNKGNTVLIIEHNMEVIKVADYIIDMGPEGGEAGGSIICEGTPEQIMDNKDSKTAHFIKTELTN